MPFVDAVQSARALSVYAEPLVAGRRVMVVGDASSGIAALLIELGARLVHVYETDAARASAAEPTRGVTVHLLPERDFDVRDGAFDVAIVPDLSIVPEREALLARLRRILGQDGAALVAARNPAAARIPATERSIDYYELYELVSMQFESVRMVGQVPFVGVAMVELGVDEDETDVTVDAQLAGESTPPEMFVALASQNDAELAKYAIVQLPDVEEHPPASIGARASIAESKLRADVLAAQLDERSSQTRELEGRVATAMAMADRISAEAARADERYAVDLQRHQEIIASLEEEIAARAAKLAVLEAAFGALEEASREIERRAAAAERAIEEHVERANALAAELDEARAVASAAADLNGAALAHEGEVAELESLLQGRGEHVADLEREVARREQIILDLLSQIASLEGAPVERAPAERPATAGAADDRSDALYEENVRLRARLDALALDLARREGELATTAWRVTELEEELAHRTKQAAPPTGPFEELGKDTAFLRAELDKARDELDMLRRALAQEHEARVRERGEGDAHIEPKSATTAQS